MARIFIDTDPGVDDMAAILMAAGSRRLEIVGVSTAGGNTGIDQTTRNAIRILDWVHRQDVPVFAGAAEPMVHAAGDARHVHGADGLHGAAIPISGRCAQDQPTSGAIPAVSDGCAIACLGPLTNIAQALIRSNSWRPERIIVMGGAFGIGPAAGNVRPNAEFNIHWDPEAARIVFESGLPLTLVPLDVTFQAPATGERLERIRAVPRIGPELARVLRAYTANSRTRWNLEAGPIHDANVIAYLDSPDLYRGSRGRISVVTEGSDRGRTLFEPDAAGPHQVLDSVDAEGFFDLLINCLRRASLRRAILA